MGAGQYPAGGYPGGPFNRAGVDPVWVGPPPAPPVQFRAIKFDPKTRTFVFNADGTAYDVHPIDQQVVLLLWVQQGQIRGASTVGNRIKRRIARASPLSIPAIIRDEVQLTLDPLIQRGDIALLRIDVDASQPTRAAYACFYKNLRDTQNTNPREVPVRV